MPAFTRRVIHFFDGDHCGIKLQEQWDRKQVIHVVDRNSYSRFLAHFQGHRLRLKL